MKKNTLLILLHLFTNIGENDLLEHFYEFFKNKIKEDILMPYKLLCLHNCDETNINFNDAFDIDTFDDIDITTINSKIMLKSINIVKVQIEKLEQALEQRNETYASELQDEFKDLQQYEIKDYSDLIKRIENNTMTDDKAEITKCIYLIKKLKNIGNLILNKNLIELKKIIL